MKPDKFHKYLEGCYKDEGDNYFLIHHANFIDSIDDYYFPKILRHIATVKEFLGNVKSAYFGKWLYMEYKKLCEMYGGSFPDNFIFDDKLTKNELRIILK
jgi:hypothetical protein